jgi:diaminopimelate epimerase
MLSSTKLILPFFKYHGAGNDFILVDDREKIFPEDDIEFIEVMCNRRTGIGADGLILLQKGSFPVMRYFNSDGKESTFCGNGGRCFTAWCRQLGLFKGDTVFRFIAKDGLHLGKVLKSEENNFEVSITMQDVEQLESYPGFFVLNTGSPHAVKWQNTPAKDHELQEAVQKIRFSEQFEKEGINVNLAWQNDDGTIAMRTYERGVEAETLACGTGTVAVAIVGAWLNNLPPQTQIHAKGGNLKVQFTKNRDRFIDIKLIGPAQFVFEGLWKS